MGYPQRSRLRDAARALIAVLALGLAGCSSLPWMNQEPTLYSPINGSAGVGRFGMSPGGKLSEGDIPVCIDEVGSATITRVEPIDPVNGLTVVAFAVRTIPPGTIPPGDGLSDLTAMGMTPAEQAVRVVSNVCGEQARANVGLDGSPPEGTPDPRVDLVVTVTAPVLPAKAQGLRIYYKAGAGDERSTTSAFAIAMCEGLEGDCPPSE